MTKGSKPPQGGLGEVLRGHPRGQQQGAKNATLAPAAATLWLGYERAKVGNAIPLTYRNTTALLEPKPLNETFLKPIRARIGSFDSELRDGTI